MKLQHVCDAGDILHFLKSRGIQWNDGCDLLTENEVHGGRTYTEEDFAVGLSWRTDEKFCNLMLDFFKHHGIVEFYLKGKPH